MPVGLKTLIAVPSPMEWRVLYPEVPFSKTIESPHGLSSSCDAACVGIGLVGFAGNLAQLIHRLSYQRILLVGVAGALPGSGLSPADTVRVDEECVGDEGYLENDSFAPYFRRPHVFRATSARLAPKSVSSLSGVRGVSVNTLTANPRILECRAKYFRAALESMEGASAFAVARALDVQVFEIRTISNFTGDLDESRWNLRESLRSVNQKVLQPLLDEKT